MLVNPEPAPGIEVINRVCIVEIPAEALRPRKRETVVGVDLIGQVSIAVVPLSGSQRHIDRGIRLVIGWGVAEDQILLEWVEAVQVVVIDVELPVRVNLPKEAPARRRIRGIVITPNRARG